MIDLGFLISFSGILTFPKAGSLREVAAQGPRSTGCSSRPTPLTSPRPPPGSRKRNEPAFVVETARVLAGLKGIPLEELADATTRNFLALFGASRPI